MPIRPLARLLRPVRAGINRTTWHHPATVGAPETIKLTSDAFHEDAPIPIRHAGKGVGDDISPHLRWTGVPPGTAELVLIIEDPDVPLPRPIVHGVFTGIDPSRTEIAEGALALGTGMRVGTGAFGRRGYAGPRPIPGHGPHHYIFQLYALDKRSDLPDGASLTDTLAAIDGHIIARGSLTGTYERP
ncbi:YbhB/YbcL family Raf kinase inhibitor-like protein [Nocardia sp. NPDC088792]|uniref:YbhB/YbcL family Raf kinase inhibitor-like protein n=1 Tax=Nocardia sp. NPDC088792 TaxID=3364332 RepID=UPI0037FCAA5D